MKIVGIGVDIIENSRINRLVSNKKFINRVFSKSEIIMSKRIKKKSLYFAKRFSAKEAFVKSLGSGLRNGINFNDISIVNDKLGKPSFSVNKKINMLIKKNIKPI